MAIGKAPGAQFEVSIDGRWFSFRFREVMGNVAAEYVKRRFPDCDVMVKHLPGGKVTVAAYSPTTIRADAAHDGATTLTPAIVRAFGAGIEVDGGGAFRDKCVAVVADDVEVMSFGFAHELPEHDAGSEGADVAKGGHGIVVRH
jgi:hypothetical protein